MQQNARVNYILDNLTWVPWNGTPVGFGGVTLFNLGGDAITSVTGTSDAIAPNPALSVGAFNYGFNGTNWDRLRSFGNNVDNVATATGGILGSVTFGYFFDGGNWDRMRGVGDSSDGVSAGQTGLLVTDRATIFNGTTWDRRRSVSAATVSAAAQLGVTAVANCGNWSINHTPAANTQATISRAAVASQRHVCTSISAVLFAPVAVASGTVTLNLRDGATGAGTILWSQSLQVGGAASISADRAIITLSGLSIFGTANTAMTLEFSAAGGASTVESVALTGYTLA